MTAFFLWKRVKTSQFSCNDDKLIYLNYSILYWDCATIFAALAEASVIVREHSPVVNLFMCLWFNEVVRFTSRDQLSFPYVLWRLKLVKKINMFPVCIRKDLVNSMGHIRKAKPLNVSRLSWDTLPLHSFEACKLCIYLIHSLICLVIMCSKSIEIISLFF